MILRTTATVGHRMRSGEGTNYPIIRSVFPGTSIYADDMYRPRLGTSQWVYVRVGTQTGWMQGTWLVYVSADPYQAVWNYGHALYGLHGPADPPDWAWREDIFLMYKRTKMQAALVLVSADIGARVINRLRADNIVPLGRAFNSIDASYKKKGAEYILEIADPIRRVYDAGMRYFQIHNEPNLFPYAPANFPGEGMGVSWKNGREFAVWFEQAAFELKKIAPEALIGFPAMSPGPEYLSPIPFRYSGERMMAEALATGIPQRVADFYGCHSYWLDHNWQASLAEIATFAKKYPNKLILVTEFSNAAPWMPKDVKGQQYAEFYKEAKRVLPSNVGALCAYVAAATYGFDGERWEDSNIPSIVEKGLAA